MGAVAIDNRLYCRLRSSQCSQCSQCSFVLSKLRAEVRAVEGDGSLGVNALEHTSLAANSCHITLWHAVI